MPEARLVAWSGRFGSRGVGGVALATQHTGRRGRGLRREKQPGGRGALSKGEGCVHENF